MAAKTSSRWSMPVPAIVFLTIRGILSIEAQNLFDERFSFQNRSLRPDLNVAPRYAPELTVIGRATLSF
jgi:hypothetical protein